MNTMSRSQARHRAIAYQIECSCRIPDDCIDEKRYPLFMARAVMRELIESLQSNPGESPC